MSDKKEDDQMKISPMKIFKRNLKRKVEKIQRKENSNKEESNYNNL